MTFNHQSERPFHRGENRTAHLRRHDDVTRTLREEDSVRLPPQARDTTILIALTVISAVISLASVATLVALCWHHSG